MKTITLQEIEQLLLTQQLKLQNRIEQLTSCREWYSPLFLFFRRFNISWL